MNTYITSHKAKVRHLFCFLILCFHLVSAGVPGPCKHSVTQNHFINLRRLIKNQLQNGCSITYTFIERQNLSVVCYVKAAFPHILHLLNTHFRYAKDSDNYRYTNSLKNLIYNIYSQRCIPPINEEIEDNPSKFVKVYMTLPRTALERVEEVLRIYMNLMTEGDRSVDWNCEEEYIEDYPESTSEPLSQTPDAAECPCICPTLNPGSSRTPVSTSQWNIYLESTPSPKESYFTHAVILQDSDGGSGQLKSKIRNQGPKSIPDTSPITVLQNPQLAPVLQTPAPWTSTQGDFSNYLFGSTPGLPDETSNFILEMDTHTPSSDIPLKEIPDFFPRRTDPFHQSALSGPHRKSTKDGTQNILDKSTGLLLAKRSLDSKIHKGLSNTYIRLLQNWIATTSAPITDTKCTGTRKTPTAKDKPFQTLQMNKHIVPVRTAALDSMKTSVDSSEDLTTLVDQPGHPNTPPKTFEIHTHMPKNFLKNP